MRTIENYVLRPEIVLDTIFDILKYEPETLVSCTRVSKSWDGALWSKKPEFMFHLVLPLVVKRLSREDVFSCRIACRNWKNAVDGLNDQIPPWNHHIDSVCPWRFNFRVVPFSGWSFFGYDERNDPYTFLNLMTNKSSGSPFPTRSVVFYTKYAITSKSDSDEVLHPDDILERYGENYFDVAGSLRSTNYFHEILRNFGSHISHLVYDVFSPVASCDLPTIKLDLSPKDIVRMLNFVPHLRSLTIVDIESRCTDYWNCPPPLLPNLSSLTLRFQRSVPVITHFLLTSYGSQLHTLECLDEDLFLPQKHDGITPFVFPNLKNLKVIASLGLLSRNYKRYVQNLNSSVMAPCLERLSIELFHLSTHCPMLLNLMKGISGAFSSSIVELYVHVLVTMEKCGCAAMDTSSMTKDAAGGVNLPHLTNFHINFPLSSSVLCVLTNLASIQDLHLIGGHNVNVSGEEVYQLWSTRPNLQRLYVGGRVQTRRQAELHAAVRDGLRRLRSFSIEV